MKQKYIEYFKDLYNYCSQHNTTSATVDISTDRVYDSDCIKYLVNAGYIKISKSYLRNRIIQITPLGINFAENSFIESQNSYVIQGDNSIYINGINNTVSNNYDEFCAENSSITLANNENNKIKDYFSKVSSGVFTTTASNILTFLFTMIFSKISS